MPGEFFFIFEDGITAKDIKQFMSKQKAKLKNVVKQEGNTKTATRKRKNDNNLGQSSSTKFKKSTSDIEKQSKHEDDVTSISSSFNNKCCCDFESDSGIEVKCSHCSDKKGSQNICGTSIKPANTNKLNFNNQIEVCKSKNCNGKKSTKRLDRLRRKQFKEKLQKYLSQSDKITSDVSIYNSYSEQQNGYSSVENVFKHSAVTEKNSTASKSTECSSQGFVIESSTIASLDTCDYVYGNHSSTDNISHRTEDTKHTDCFGLPEGDYKEKSMDSCSTDKIANLNVTSSKTFCKCHSHFGQHPSEFVALDCEFVGVGSRKTNALGRCSIVDYNGSVIYDEYCRPDSPITDYRTKWSGIRRKHMKQALPFDVVQKKIMSLIKDKVVVGHALFNDFKVLQYKHPPCMIRDTSAYIPLRQKAGLQGTQKISLKNLSKTLLGLDIQQKEHCSVEDSQAAMRLYKQVQLLWEQDISDQHNQTKMNTQKIQDELSPESIQKTMQKNQSIDICQKMECCDEDSSSDHSQKVVVNNSYLDDKFWPCDLFE